MTEKQTKTNGGGEMEEITLFRKYGRREITRDEFCRQLAKAQGFNYHVRGTADACGQFIEYRGRTITIYSDHLAWNENGHAATARSLKELKIKIDIAEIKAAA